jgi:hypothetical protein
MYRAVTIPHAIKLNAMLAKNKSCGSMKFSFLGENSSHSQRPLPRWCSVPGQDCQQHTQTILAEVAGQIGGDGREIGTYD